LDRLPWWAWNRRVVIALGVSWLLDGLEVTVVGSLGPALERPDTLGLTAGEIGWAASAYIGGAVLGALFFGRLADSLGRKRMFLVTLVVYLVATVLTALSFNVWSFAICRFFTGFGIGGEYAAINSAIDELIPARVRGTVDLAINGTFWIGAAMGAPLSAPRGARPRADGLAGAFLQCDLFYLCPGARALLRRAGAGCRLLHLPLRSRQLPRSAGAGAAVRQRRAAPDDRNHLRDRR